MLRKSTLPFFLNLSGALLMTLHYSFQCNIANIYLITRHKYEPSHYKINVDLLIIPQHSSLKQYQNDKLHYRPSFKPSSL